MDKCIMPAKGVNQCEVVDRCLSGKLHWVVGSKQFSYWLLVNGLRALEGLQTAVLT